MIACLVFGGFMVRNTDSAVCFTPWFPRSDRSDDCLSAWRRKSFSAPARKRTLKDYLPSQIPKRCNRNDEWTWLKKRKKKKGCRWDSACVTQCSPGCWCVKIASFSLISAEEHCNNIYCRVTVCVGVCEVFRYMQPLFGRLSVFIFFSNEGQKADGHTRSAKQAFSTARMFKVF